MKKQLLKNSDDTDIEIDDENFDEEDDLDCVVDDEDDDVEEELDFNHY